MYGGGKVDWREEGKVGKGEGGAFLKTEALQPSFTPRRSGGRDESAPYITVELCACRSEGA
jgi:hypothetical protein